MTDRYSLPIEPEGEVSHTALARGAAGIAVAFEAGGAPAVALVDGPQALAPIWSRRALDHGVPLVGRPAIAFGSRGVAAAFVTSEGAFVTLLDVSDGSALVPRIDVADDAGAVALVRLGSLLHVGWVDARGVHVAEVSFEEPALLENPVTVTKTPPASRSIALAPLSDAIGVFWLDGRRLHAARVAPGGAADRTATHELVDDGEELDVAGIRGRVAVVLGYRARRERVDLATFDDEVTTRERPHPVLGGPTRKLGAPRIAWGETSPVVAAHDASERVVLLRSADSDDVEATVALPRGPFSLLWLANRPLCARVAATSVETTLELIACEPHGDASIPNRVECTPDLREDERRRALARGLVARVSPSLAERTRRAPRGYRDATTVVEERDGGLGLVAPLGEETLSFDISVEKDGFVLSLERAQRDAGAPRSALSGFLSSILSAEGREGAREARELARSFLDDVTNGSIDHAERDEARIRIALSLPTLPSAEIVLSWIERLE
jgi:hypothetical protein